MRHRIAVFLIVLGFGGGIVAQSLPSTAAAGAYVGLLTIDGTIDPISSNFLSRGIDLASEDGSQFLILRLDTPGGLFDSTRKMVEKILASKIPVVVYVSPPGAQAASAGTFITAAAHIAVMAPATNIGAASPVGPGGEDLPETIKSKATQDAAAFLRSIALERDRNAVALEQTVLSALSYSAAEAVDKGVVDIIADDIEALLLKLDGWEVQLRDGTAVLSTQGLEVREIRRTLVERFLGFLADPNIAFLLLTLGGMGIFLEFLSPGLIAPGLAGIIMLALAFVALGNLPVNWVGVGLIMLGLVLFFVETQAPGIGMFGISGAISFVLGAFLLFGGFSPPPITTPSFRVNIWLIGTILAVLFGYLILLIRTVVASRAAHSPTTYVNLVGQAGKTTTSLDPRGTVLIAGELWSAESDSGEDIPEGEEVIILEVVGLTLKVFKASNA